MSVSLNLEKTSWDALLADLSGALENPGAPLDPALLGERMVAAVFATGRPVLEVETLTRLARLVEALDLRVAHAGWRQVAAFLAQRAPAAVAAGDPAPWLAAIAARALEVGRAEALSWGLSLAVEAPLPVSRCQDLHRRLWQAGLLGAEENAAFLESLQPPTLRLLSEDIPKWLRFLLLLGLMEQRPMAYAQAMVEGVALPALLAAAAADQRALALQVEIWLCVYWVKREESHAHYARWIGRWAPALAALGRRNARAVAIPRPGPEGRPRIALLVNTATHLAHVAVMLTMLEACMALPGRRFDYEVHVMHGRDQELFARLRAMGVVALAHELPADVVMADLLEVMARRLFQSAPAALVWLCVPFGLAYAFGRRLAPVQVWWSVKFHPPAAPDADLRLGTFPAQPLRLDREGHAWLNLPGCMEVELAPPDPAARAALRAPFGGGLLLGTLAREEKMAEPAFQQAVIAILRAVPGAHWVYTGQAPAAGLLERLAEAGLEGRAHFIGWVDTARWAAALDLHLESFPMAGGLVSMQCAAQAVPSVFLTYPVDAPMSGLLDNHLHRARRDATLPAAERAQRDALLTTPSGLDAAPALDDVAAYVAWACRLAREDALRAEVGQAQQAYVARYLADHATPARAFEAALEEALSRAAGTARTA
ncbi:hypothetical protein NON00_17340 [Roseomonas sp. GC11]|uniref:hypothetical protein n=1 Tax=Roseomonas sp. GC11 TaxID=2950546 RepID=UPI0021088407|nr:hypothetical protein [Roseomonas sp. GC11]MCQ4161681.1 hypothetical protein [Roseomonas sp. GC11]